MALKIEAVKTVTTKPMGVIIYARSGLGKTTFLGDYVRNAKNGILFQCGEDALGDLNPEWANSVPHYPNILGDYYELATGEDDSKWSTMERDAKGWTWFKDELMKYLMLEAHGYTHVAFDSFDNLINRNLDAYVTLTYYKGNAEKANSFGGSKLKEMYMELAVVVKCFEYLQKKGINVLISSHAQTINFKDPASADYKKWSIAVPAREDYNLRNLLINWSSATLFGTIDVDVEGKKASGGRHVLKTKDDAAFDAKCRYEIQEEIDFNYATFKEIILKAIKKGDK